MVRGRPPRIGNELCPIHKVLGYSCPKTTWNANYPNTKRRQYRYFVHNDRTIQKHSIPVEKPFMRFSEDDNIQIGREFNRRKQNVTTFQRDSKKSFFRQASTKKVLPIVTYLLITTSKKKSKLGTELKKLRKESIKSKDLADLLDDKTVKEQPRVEKFIQKLKARLLLQYQCRENEPPYYNIVMDYGENSIKNADIITKLPLGEGEELYTTEELDRYGVITKIQEKRNQRKKLSKAAEHS